MVSGSGLKTKLFPLGHCNSASNMSTLTIVPTPADAEVVLTATGYTQIGNSITVDNGTTVDYEVSKTGYATVIGSELVTESKELQIVLEESSDVTLTVIATPADSNIILIAEGYTQIGNRITVEGGTSVLVEVSRDGYATYASNIIMTENRTLEISLSGGYYMAVAGNSNIAAVSDLENYQTWSNTDLSVSRTWTKIIYTKKSIQVPPGYTQLEYLTFDGSQHINTGYQANQDTAFEIDYKGNSTVETATRYLYGSYEDSTTNFYASVEIMEMLEDISVADNIGYFDGQSLGSETSYYAIQRNKLLQSKNNVYRNGTLTSISTSVTTASITLDFLIGNTSTTSGTYGAGFAGKIYSAKIWDSTGTVRNFIPAKRNSDNELGFYDTISKTFFTNAGTGTFTEGPTASDTCINRYMITATSTNLLLYSTDGVNWSDASLPEAKNWYSVAYGNGVAVAVATNYGYAAYSTDGINWDTAPLPSDTTNWRTVGYGNGVFIALPGLSTKKFVAYSTDGINWTKVTTPVGGIWNSITYGNGKFVALGTNAAGMYSYNGVEWFSAPLTSGVTWASNAYGIDKFVAVSSQNGRQTISNIAAYSYDGITWTQTTLPNRYKWQSVCIGIGFVAVAAGTNAAAYSEDGITWTAITLPDSRNWGSICYSLEQT